MMVYEESNSIQLNQIKKKKNKQCLKIEIYISCPDHMKGKETSLVALQHFCVGQFRELNRGLQEAPEDCAYVFFTVSTPTPQPSYHHLLHHHQVLLSELPEHAGNTPRYTNSLIKICLSFQVYILQSMCLLNSHYWASEDSILLNKQERTDWRVERQKSKR